jgi:hypothetical protein
MRSKFFIILLITLLAGSCELDKIIEINNGIEGVVTYYIENGYDSVEETDLFRLHFATDVSYRGRNGEIHTETDIKTSEWSAKVWVDTPFEAVLEIRHTLRPEYKDANPYTKIPVYTGNICGLMLDNVGEESELNWIGRAPFCSRTEMYLINIDQFLSKYGTQRYTLNFTKDNWDLYKQFR